MTDAKKEEFSFTEALFGAVPVALRAGIGVALRAVTSKPEAVDALARHVYLDEFDGEPETPWEKLPAKEKKVRRQAVRATLEGLDRVAKLATTG